VLYSLHICPQLIYVIGNRSSPDLVWTRWRCITALLLFSNKLWESEQWVVGLTLGPTILQRVWPTKDVFTRNRRAGGGLTGDHPQQESAKSGWLEVVRQESKNFQNLPFYYWLPWMPRVLPNYTRKKHGVFNHPNSLGFKRKGTYKWSM